MRIAKESAMTAAMKFLTLSASALVLAACAQTPAPPISSRSVGPSTSLAAQSASADIRDAQQRLQALGLYRGSVDGMWGPETQVATERFQRNRGLAHTAILDRKTVAALKDETPSDRLAAIARPVNISDPTDVRTIQNRLRQLNFYSGVADGVWGPRTQVALERFQKSHGLPVGQITGQTISAMGLDADTFPTQTVSAGLIAQPLHPNVVRGVQRRLRQQGFYTGGPDGVWGPRTRSAVEHFQRSRGLDATGDLNPKTAAALGVDPNNLSMSAR
jgi:N-acetylmuramoyl-L-alanine amidase